MGDGVKCCTKVKEDEDGERTAISCNKEVTGDFYEGNSGAVVGGRNQTGKGHKGNFVLDVYVIEWQLLFQGFWI